MDVCALSLLRKSPRAQAAGAARLAEFTVRAGAQCPRSGRLCVEFAISIFDEGKLYAFYFSQISFTGAASSVVRDVGSLSYNQ